MARIRKRRSRLLNPTNLIALMVLSGCLLAGGWLTYQADLWSASPDQWMERISQLGWQGVVFFILFLATAIVIGPIPSTPFTIAAGAVWGPILAGLYGIIGIFIGSLIAYFIGRTLGRSTVKALTGKVVHFSTHRGEFYVGWVIMMAHMIPVMPYELFSYGAGISGLSLPIFASTCLLGIIPCTLLLTHLGSVLTLSMPFAIAVIGLAVVVLGTLGWGVKRYNWFGLKDVISFH